MFFDISEMQNGKKILENEICKSWIFHLDLIELILVLMTVPFFVSSFLSTPELTVSLGSHSTSYSTDILWSLECCRMHGCFGCGTLPARGWSSGGKDWLTILGCFDWFSNDFIFGGKVKSLKLSMIQTEVARLFVVEDELLNFCHHLVAIGCTLGML